MALVGNVLYNGFLIDLTPDEWYTEHNLYHKINYTQHLLDLLESRQNSFYCYITYFIFIGHSPFWLDNEVKQLETSSKHFTDSL